MRRRSTSLPTVAAITMVRDEGVMLPRWIAHYSREVGAENLVVIDDNSSDGSTDALPCPVIKVPPLTKEAFEPARMGMLSDLAASLLHAYDAVLFADADEFLVADPDRYDSLRDYVADNPKRQIMGAVGMNVAHLPGEPPLDPGAPVLGQRRFAKYLPLMCKPSLKRVPAAWRWASHGIMAPYEVDPRLYLFHLKFADRDLLREASERRRQMVEHDGRAKRSSWSLGGEDLVAVLDDIAQNARPDEAPTFSIGADRLKDVVEKQPDGSYRAVGRGQVIAMRRRPLVRVPERFLGRF